VCQSLNMLKLYKYTIKVIKWLAVSFGDSALPLNRLLSLNTSILQLIQARGEREALIYIKALRSDLINYLSGNVIKSGKVRLTGDGIPVFLGDLIPFVRSKSYRVIAMICTILWATRALSLGSKQDISSIVDPSKEVTNNIFMFAGSFWRELGYKPAILVTPKVLEAKLEKFRSKSGPNGHALSSCFADAKLHTPESFAALGAVGGENLQRVAQSVAHDMVSSFFVKFASKLKTLVVTGTTLRRLATFNDKEDKVRYIGIVDWWSQLALEPLHHYLANVLKKINQDCTFDQSNFKKSLRSAKIYYSVDLSAATDRFPITGIEKLLRAQLPQSYVTAWKYLMVGIPFDYMGRLIYYSTGNPMGAYSSFNSFALTHHYLIYYCCRVLGKDWKSLPYALLGDDIVIGDKDVGEMYMGLLSQLGLDYSPSKTHKSLHFFEFAKRMFLNGVEITPFPISGLKACGQDISMLTTLLFETIKKEWIPISIPSSVYSYLGIVRQLPSRVKSKGKIVSQHVESVLNIAHGIHNAEVYVNTLIREMSLPLPVLDNTICENILSNVIVGAFADSAIFNSLKNFTVYNMPLTGQSIDWNFEWMIYSEEYKDEYMLSRHFRPLDWWDMPFALASKAVQRMYAQLTKDLYERDMTGSKWTLAMRTFALPRSDKSILAKGDYLVAKATLKITNSLKEQLLLLSQFPQLLDIRPLEEKKVEGIGFGTWQIDDIRPC